MTQTSGLIIFFFSFQKNDIIFDIRAAALQIKHGSTCLTGALYADVQAVVNNLYFTVAWLQVLDNGHRFYILHEGTDHLEGLFADCQTQDHGNFDIEQLCGKLSIATLVNAAFERNPDLDQGHQRLSLKGTTRIDHVNPQSWIGDTCISEVNLNTTWNVGSSIAIQLLHDFFGSHAAVPDFETQFSKPKHDLLRPTGHYVGINETPDPDDDRSEQESDNPVIIPEPQYFTPPPHVLISTDQRQNC